MGRKGIEVVVSELEREQLLSEPADQRLGAVCRREEPVPGAGAYAAGVADGAGLSRRCYARLYTAWHDNLVCCAQCGNGRGHRAMQVASSASGIPGVSESH